MIKESKMIKTISLNAEVKKRIDRIKERTRQSTFKGTVDFLASLYEQVAPSKRGEEMEFVEAVERGKALSFLREKLCAESGGMESKNEAKVTVRRTDGKEVKGKGKMEI